LVATVTGVVTVGLSFLRVTKAHSQEIADCGYPPWSSIHDYTGNLTDAPVTPSGLSVDRVWLPADPHIRI
jgi:hypothetical protein